MQLVFWRTDKTMYKTTKEKELEKEFEDPEPDVLESQKHKKLQE